MITRSCLPYRAATDIPTQISLFAGAGGLDIGLEAAGFITLAASDIEPHACETLRANQLLSQLSSDEFDCWFVKQLAQKCYRSITEKEIQSLRQRLLVRQQKDRHLQHAVILPGDIRQISSNDFLTATRLQKGELTLISGGPPCQPFSRAGKRQNVAVQDGQLFTEFVRTVRDLRPRWFLFENVKGLILTNTEVNWIVCAACHRQSIVPFGYQDTELSDEQNALLCTCGSDRVSIITKSSRTGSLEIIIAEFERIGYTCTWKVLNAANFGAPQIRERLFIVGSRDNEPFVWPSETHQQAAYAGVTSQATLFSDDDWNHKRPWTRVSDSLWTHGHPSFGELNPETAVLWVKNVVRPHDEAVTWSLNRPSPTIGAHQAAKLAIAPEGVPEKQLMRQQWHVLGNRQGDTPPVHVTHAYLNDAELLTLQTFPEYWYLFGTRMQRAFQIGNAVPPSLGKVVGQAILEASQMWNNALPRQLEVAHTPQ